MIQGLIYLATPYSKYPGGTGHAYVAAAVLASKLLKAGYKVFCPITHGHPISVYGGLDPLDHSIWLPFDEAIMAKCDALFVANMSGWLDSHGIAMEIKSFAAAGKPIYDLDPEGLTYTRRSPEHLF
jgi:hypothetical protein